MITSNVNGHTKLMLTPNYLTDLATELQRVSRSIDDYVNANESCFLLMSPSLLERYHRLIFELRSFEGGFGSGFVHPAPSVNALQNKVLHINDFRRKI